VERSPTSGWKAASSSSSAWTSSSMGRGVGGYHLLGEVLVIQQLQGEPLGVGEPVNDGGLEVLGELDPERSVPPFSMLSPSLK
jgi:hypothetical protein